jgi:C-terminal peptidase prc
MRIILLFIVLMLISCGEVSGPERDMDDMELLYNHRLLKFYFYRPDSVRDFSAYEDMAEVDSMYASLRDTLRGWRYTRYHKPDVAEQVISDVENSYRYYSFGFERRLNEDTLIVSAVYPNSPANSAGLKKYDKLLHANELPLTGEDAALYAYTDSLFDEVTAFEVLRGDSIELLSPMQKEEVREPTVYLDSLEGIPLIRVTEFTKITNDPDGTYQEFKNALREIKGANTAIIDMQNNGGGSIYHCTAMAAELSPPDKELVYDVEHYAQNRGGNAVGIIDTAHYYARDFREREGNGVDIKWVIMVNGGSASCTERFAASVKSARPDAVIVGQTTYGKGVGQSYMSTYLGGAAFITSLQTFFPNGETFHRVGVRPDVNVPIGENYKDNYEKISIAALEEALKFTGILAKRAPAEIKNLPPERIGRKVEFGMHKPILPGF